MKRLVIDARESGTSTGRYIDKLVENLSVLKPEIEVILLAKASRTEYLKKVAPNFRVVEANYKEFTFAEQLGFKRAIKSLRPDLVHFAKDHQPVLYHGRVVTTMHDLTTARFRNPDKNPLAFQLKQSIYKQVVKWVARKSVAVLTGSEFVKNDIVKFAGITPEKITVTYEAADQITDRPEPVPGIQGNQFIMYVGRPTPHKNLERLIEAFTMLQARRPELYLVLAGKKDANYRRIETSVQKRAIKNIVFTDFVSEGQLRWLYQHCATYVFPSLSEGFGLPGLEAMAHDAPVVSSSATCLPEIYGEAAHYFDPLDVQSMVNAIDEVLTNKDLRKRLVENGREQVNKYSWRRMAEETLAAYEKVLKS